MLKIRLFALVVMGGLAMTLNPVSNAEASSLESSELIDATLATARLRGWCELDAVASAQLEDDRFIELLRKVLDQVNDQTRQLGEEVKVRIQEVGLTASMLQFAKYLYGADLTPGEEGRIRQCLEPFDHNPDVQELMRHSINIIRRIWLSSQELDSRSALQVSDLFQAVINMPVGQDQEGIAGLEYICQNLLTTKYQLLMSNVSNPFSWTTFFVKDVSQSSETHDLLSCVQKIVPRANMLLMEGGGNRYKAFLDEQMQSYNTWHSLNPVVSQVAKLKGFKEFIVDFAKQGVGLDGVPLALLSTKLDQVMGADEDGLSQREDLVRRMFRPSNPNTPFAVLGFLRSLKIATPNAFSDLLFMEEQVFGCFASICYGLLSSQTYQGLLD